jgi:hypothetical protein
MKQSEATQDRPFYSVTYRYENGSTNYGCNRFDERPLAIGGDYRTMPGTDNLKLAKRVAYLCAQSCGIAEAWVHVTRDCYNHSEVYHATRA